MTKQPIVYVLASKRNGTLYIGVTSDPGCGQSCLRLECSCRDLLAHVSC